ncbi:methyltransferase family protein [Aquisalinus flavus]|uniref:Isoprenylcysteine carboxyl methyltransferase n=1 Tax=Aquisalinus flavus TaxID=1526572 RepID=A0A8J2V200_9PROT|nr:isoprenylcysteine carboxylmethyltransferase family protein [Aquisalinus flavus]MBD0425682.1 isoprenylcysteine carboxylmethyltransferase family protein [Aquisalinus flavus]UNE48706.1 isoprenylcysteine carboxylmethyltransferase family protein [Aquisalinus flavus]GGD14101.1 hypothetical protein GCM10011342_23590 [Aquisalinus flavus]
MHIPPVLQLLFWAVIAWGLARLFPGLAWDWGGQDVTAAVLALAGIGVAVAGIVQFRRHRTTVNPVALERASAIVTDGVYRYSRNPMYLGLALVLTGWVTLLGNPLGALTIIGFVVVMTIIQIAPEERVLAKKFGAEYAAYLKRTRRWL